MNEKECNNSSLIFFNKKKNTGIIARLLGQKYLYRRMWAREQVNHFSLVNETNSQAKSELCGFYTDYFI